MTHCYDEEAMVDYLASRMPRPEAAELVCHCDGCMECDRKLREMDLFMRVYWPKFRFSISDIIGEPSAEMLP